MLKKLIINVFTFPAAFFLNAAIIVIVELSGTFFYDTGLIHAIAILFLMTSFAGLFIRYYIADPITDKFILAAKVSLIVFSLAHVAEYLGYEVLHTTPDAALANVVHVYIISILLLIIGVEYILKSFNKKTSIVYWLSGAGIIFLTGFIIAVFLNDKLIDLDPSRPASYIYGALVLGLFLLTASRVHKVKIIAPLSLFTRYMNIGMGLIILAILPNIFYELLEQGLHIPEYQIVYIAHFTFLLALSFMSVAFSKLAQASERGLAADALAYSKRKAQ